MLAQIADFNDLSPALLKKLQDKIQSFGKVVKYRFDIEQDNPDRTFYNGKTIFPNTYTLDPTVFNITDKEEEREGKSQFKKIALIKSHEPNGTGGYKTEYIKIRVTAAARGVLRLDLEKPEDIAKCMLMELHPKLKNGLFTDITRVSIFGRIDDVMEADAQSKERAERRKALNAVSDMDDAALRQFADAIGDDSSQDPIILRNLAEEQAEIDPKFFNDLVADKLYEYRATIKQALDREIIAFDPGSFVMTWKGTGQIITSLSPAGAETEVVKFATFLYTGGAKAEEAYKKITQLVKEAKKPASV